MTKNRRISIMGQLWIVLGLLVSLLSWAGTSPASAADDSQYFEATRHTVSGKFLEYWRANGGLPVYGYPITDARMEVDPETGKTFLTQWFERNRFELHPEFTGTKYEVLLGLLGNDLRREALQLDSRFKPADRVTDPNIPADKQFYSVETRHNIYTGFVKYWWENGGVEHVGYPIAEPGEEVDPETGKIFMVQWFERARFELHPENAGTQYEILLGLLGNQIKTPRNKINFSWRILGDYAEANSQKSQLYLYNGPKDGLLYIADGFKHEIQVYSANGLPVRSWGSRGSEPGKFNFPVGMAQDSQGNLYVADSGNNRVQKFDPLGHYLSSLSYTTVDNKPLHPFSLAIDSKDSLYVGDFSAGRVVKFDSSAKYLWDMKVEGFLQLILIDPKTDNVYLKYTFNDDLVEFDPQGKYLKQFGGILNFGTSINGLSIISGAVDKEGNFYLTDYNQIRKYNINGQLLASYSPGGRTVAYGAFSRINSISVDSDGNIFVSDYNNVFIQKFTQVQ